MNGERQTGTAEAANSRQISPARNPPSEGPLAEGDYFQRIFNSAPIGIFQSTEDRVIRVNPILAEMLGHSSPAELTAYSDQPGHYFVRSEDRHTMIRAALTTTDYVCREVECRRKDRSILCAMVRLRAVRDDLGHVKFFEGFVENMGPLKEAEKQARAALEYRQILLHSAPIGIGTYRATGEMVSANPAMARMIGGHLEEILQQNCWKLDSWKKSGLNAAAQRALQTGRSEVVEINLSSTFGKSIWVCVQVIPFAYAGEPHLLVLLTDMTERRHIEQQLRQAQKMEEIGRLAGGVAHDFNNIVAAILMNLGYLRQGSELTLGMKETLKEVESEAMKAANLTRQLLLFSRQHVARLEPLDVNALIQDLLKMLRRLLRENIEIDFQGSPVPLCVDADCLMLEQSVMNLCTNARDAMPKGGRLCLRTALVERAANAPQSPPEARPGRFACISVADTGCGMEAPVLQHLFEPFFTTKEVGQGTGLGLATVYGIIKQHQGWIEVESVPGQGSLFRIYLPAVAKAPPAASAPKNLSESEGCGSETILLVEDEGALRRTAALCLRKCGYSILEAPSGPEAVKLWDQNKDRVDLLFTDMVMPGAMTGAELAERLRRDKPALRVIISSGYSGAPAEAEPNPTVSYLPKPYRLPALAAIVRQCLDQQTEHANGNNENKNLPG